MSERLNSGFVRLAAACAAMSVAGAVHGQTVIYVDDDAPGGGDGQSWETALDDLQDALWAFRILSESVEIRVAGGTYLPSQNNVVWKSFDLTPNTVMSGVTLRIHGGFRGLGGGGSPDERDLNQFATILSGDLNGDDLPGFVNYDDNTRQIIKISSYWPSSGWMDLILLDGLTIRGAQWDGVTAGMNSYGFVRIANCTIAENSSGGAEARGNVEFANCLFMDNSRHAIEFQDDSGPARAANCTFTGSTSSSGVVRARGNEGYVINSIFFDNGSSRAISGAVSATHCIFPEFYPGDGNLIGDPMLVDPTNGDYRLRFDSPCIDAGNTRFASIAGSFDMFSNPRVVDDPVALNLGIGDYGFIDMGMLEYQGCEGDLNDDGDLNSQDLLAFLNRLAEGCR